MHKRLAWLAAAALCAIAVDARAESAERFQRLTGAQIQARLAGMEINRRDALADVFAASGTLTSYSMGRKSNGTWRVQKDELCIDRGKDDGGCYQVWLAGRRLSSDGGFDIAVGRHSSKAERASMSNAHAT